MHIIDVHTHIFPNTLAERALTSLSENSGDFLPQTDATVAGLLSSMDESKIETSWIANIATKPAQAKAILEWSLSIRSNRIEPLGSVHPMSPNYEEELDAFAASGFSGIKLHPLYQNFYVDDSALNLFFRAFEKTGMFLLIHSGDDIAFPGMDNSSPKRMRTFVDQYDIDVIAAHFGGWNVWDSVLTELAGSKCFIDTSFLPFVETSLREAIFEKHGTDRILFGSDSPWQSQEKSVSFLRSLSLHDDDLNKIFFRNTQGLIDRKKLS